MMRENPQAFSAQTRAFSMGRTLSLLEGLREDGQAIRKAS
jgi:hypothetical protein